MPEPDAYLLAGQPAELERLQTQSKVWEPAGRGLLAEIPDGNGRAAVDVGCGALGWLRVLSEWVGTEGSVVGSDIDDKMLAAAGAFVGAEKLANASVVKDDIFRSALPPHSFGLVHARFQVAPLGRAREQFAAYRRLVGSGGWLVVEDPDVASWRVHPEAPAVARLVDLIVAGFEAAGGDFNAGRKLPRYFRELGVEPRLRAQVVALEPGHPYLRLPVQFATSLRARLESIAGKDKLDQLMRDAEAEIAADGAWGTTFTLIQAWARMPA